MESSDHKDIPSTSGNADLAGLLAQVDSQVGCFHSAEKLNNDSAAFFFFGVFSNPAPPFPVSAALCIWELFDCRGRRRRVWPKCNPMTEGGTSGAFPSIRSARESCVSILWSACRHLLRVGNFLLDDDKRGQSESGEPYRPSSPAFPRFPSGGPGAAAQLEKARDDDLSMPPFVPLLPPALIYPLDASSSSNARSSRGASGRSLAIFLWWLFAVGHHHYEPQKGRNEFGCAFPPKRTFRRAGAQLRVLT